MEIPTEGSAPGVVIQPGSFRRRSFRRSGPLASLTLLLALAPHAAAQGTINLPSAVQGTTYYEPLSWGVGFPPFTFTLASGSSLPPGLELYSPYAGGYVLKGTPTTIGLFQFNFIVTDSSKPPLVWNQGYSVAVVAPALPLQFTTSTLPDAIYSAPYAAVLLVVGGTPPYNFNPVPPLPVGLGLDTNGYLSGEVSSPPGTYNFTLYAFDSAFPSANIQAAFTIKVDPGILVSSQIMAGATVGVLWSNQLSASGGTPPYAYALTSGALPAGLTFNGSSGLISGTPLVGGNYSFTITATDSKGLSGYSDFTLSIPFPTFTLSPASLTPDNVGLPYSVTFTVTGGTAPYAWTLESGYQLPAGLTLSSQGVLSGTPTIGGSFIFVIRATDKLGNYAVFGIVLNVYDVVPQTLPNGTVGVPYSQQLGTAGFNFTSMTVASGSLPPGLSLAAVSSVPVGQIQGTPTQVGSWTFTISASGSAGQQATRTYTFTVAAPTQPPLTVAGSAPPGWIGAAYSTVFTAGPANSGPFTFSLTAGSLPPGLTLAAGSGVLSGMPTTAGNFNFTITAQSATNSGSQAFTIQIFAAHLSIAPATVPAGAVNQNYSVTFAPSGGTAPYYIYIDQTPPGLALSYDNPASVTTATLSGQPSAAGTYTFQISARDFTGNTGSGNYSLTVTGTALTIQPSALSSFQWGVAYSVQLTASGGTPPYQFSTACSLPAGVTLSAGGLISGQPSGSGSSSCSILARDSASGAGQITYTITYVPPAFTLSPMSFPNGQVGVTYFQSVAATGATAPVQFTVSNGVLPPGLAAAPNLGQFWQLSGTPTSAGAYPFRLTATDATSHSVYLDYSITIANQPIQISPVTLPAAVVGVAYSVTFSASGGTPPYAFSASPSCPSELTLSASGLWSGTPLAVRTVTCTISATDSKGVTGSRDYQLTITSATLTLAPSTLPSGQIRVAYSVTLQASGGAPPYTFSLTQGSVPTGISLTSSGLIGGTPQQAGSFSFRIVAQDSKGASGYKDYSLQIAGDTITLGPSALPAATVGQAYSAQLTASGGSAPYTFALVSGSWYTGLQLGTSGSITGTPAGGNGATIQFTVSATDLNGSSGSATYQITVSPNYPTTLSLSPTSLPAGHIETPYSASVQASGGTPPYTYSLTQGELPNGVTLGVTGALSGTPLQIGSFLIQIGARDSAGASGSANYQIQINGDTITVTPSTLPDAYPGQTYFVQLTASGGKAPYLFEIAGGTLWASLQLTSDGRIIGTPATGSYGTDPFTLSVTDTNGSMAVVALQIVVESTLSLPAQNLPKGQVGAVYAAAIAAAGGTAPYSFALAPGAALPAGLNLSGAGAVSGTPSEAGDCPFSIVVTDATGAKASQSFTISVLPAPAANALFVSPASLSFLGTADAASTSANGCVAVFATTTASSVTASPDAAASPWASLGTGAVQTPGSLCVSVNWSSLAAGTYSGALQLSAANAQSLTIPLSLTVAAGSPPQLRAAPSSISVSAAQGSAATSMPLVIYNDGGGTLAYSIQAPSVSWLSTSAQSGSAAAGGSDAVTIWIDPSTMAAGVYSVSLTVQGAGTEQSVQVSLLVNDGPASLGVSQSAVELVGWSGGAPVSTTVGVTNQGGSAVNVSAAASPGCGGCLQPQAITQSLSPAATATAQITANPGQMTPGRYTSWVQYSAATATQVVTVGLTVLAAGTSTPSEAPLSGLVLTAGAASGTIALASPPGGLLSFNTVVEGSDTGWLTVQPVSGTTPGDGMLTLTVTGTAGTRAAGVYSATVAVGLSDGTARSVPVSLFVPTAPLSTQSKALDAAGFQPCDGSDPVAAQLLSPVSGFFGYAGRPIPVRVQIENCDGSAPGSANITARSESQDLVLAPESAGVWSGTWIPSQAQLPAILEATVQSASPQAGYMLNLQAVGAIGAGSSTDPAVTSAIPTASGRASDALAQGSWVTIGGANLASQAAAAAGPGLPSSLGGVQVLIGGQPLYLDSVSPTWLMALLPSSLPINTQQQILVVRDGDPGPPVTVAVSEIAPALFTIDGSGGGQAAALLANTATVADSSDPAARGDYVECFGSGFGPLTNSVPDGEPASLTQLAFTKYPVSATVGGQPAAVTFSGAAPGLVGIYQINIQIPASAPVGNAVQVVLTEQGVDSNPVTIAIQ